MSKRKNPAQLICAGPNATGGGEPNITLPYYKNRVEILNKSKHLESCTPNKHHNNGFE